MTMTRLEKANRMVAIYQRKCDEAAASDAPWALGNLRLYSNYLSKAVSEQCAAEREHDAGLRL
jgi:hypothetical protein